MHVEAAKSSQQESLLSHLIGGFDWCNDQGLRHSSWGRSFHGFVLTLWLTGEALVAETPPKKLRWKTLEHLGSCHSSITLPQLMGEFTPDSNYTSGLFSFAQLTDIPLTAGGVGAPEAPLRVSFYCSDWLSSPLSCLAALKWGLIVFHLRGELLEYFCFQMLSGGKEEKAKREIYTPVSITPRVIRRRTKGPKIQSLKRADKC